MALDGVEIREQAVRVDAVRQPAVTPLELLVDHLSFRLRRRQQAAAVLREIQSDKTLGTHIQTFSQIPHDLILLILEFKSQHLSLRSDETTQLDTSDLIGRFRNDPFRKYHLIYRSITINDSNSSFDMVDQTLVSHSVAWRLFLQHVRVVTVYFELGQLPSLFRLFLESASAKSAPRLQYIVFQNNSSWELGTDEWIDNAYVNARMREVRHTNQQPYASFPLDSFLDRFPIMNNFNTTSAIDVVSGPVALGKHGKVAALGLGVLYEASALIQGLAWNCASQLKSLELTLYTPLQQNLSALEQLHSLKRLYISTPNNFKQVLNSEFFAVLPTSLTCLELYYVDVQDIRGIDRLKNLWSFGFTCDNNLDSCGIESLLALPQLTILCMQQTSPVGYTKTMKQTLDTLQKRGQLSQLLLYLMYDDEDAQDKCPRFSDKDLADLIRTEASHLVKFVLQTTFADHVSHLARQSSKDLTVQSVITLLKDGRVRYVTLDVPSLQDQVSQELCDKIVDCGLLDEFKLVSRYNHQPEQ